MEAREALRMFETMIRGMYESGIRPRPYRTNGKHRHVCINGKLDALIEGQKETNDNLKEINSILKGGLKETNDNLKEINSILKGGLKETNDILQEILKKIEIRYPNGVAQSVTPGLADGLRDPSSVLRIRRRICGLLSGPACPGSPGIRAAGALLQAGP